MNRTTPLLSLALTVMACHIAMAQPADTLDRHWPAYINLDEYMVPFLMADTVRDEIVMLIQEGHALPNGDLLFPAKTILSVRDVYLNKEYEEGRDWIRSGRRIIRTDSSRMPYFQKKELVYTPEKKGMSQPGKLPGTFVLFSEQELIRSRQIAVTYIPDRTPGNYPGQLHRTDKLPQTTNKLTSKQPLHIVFWGNSIETGANSSGFMHVPPFMPNWTQLFVYQLRRQFDSPVSFANLAVGGKTADWGLQEINQVIEQKPDLVVIGFGMNDGTSQVPADTFTNRIKQIMHRISSRQPNCEFIVITPMLANPDAIQDQLQFQYRQPLLALETKGVAIADVTYWHRWLLTHKSYQDMTGNNINHPNDYLARWYAQVLAALFN